MAYETLFEVVGKRTTMIGYEISGGPKGLYKGEPEVL